MSKVYFSTARTLRWDYNHSIPGKLKTLLEKMDLSSRFAEDEWVAIKTHWGSHGAFRIVPPVMIRKVVEAVRSTGAKPFVTDTVRIMGLDYIEVANQNGLNHLSCNAPVVLADGLFGMDSILVKAGPILGEIAVASTIHDVPAMIVCSIRKATLPPAMQERLRILPWAASAPVTASMAGKKDAAECTATERRFFVESRDLHLLRTMQEHMPAPRHRFQGGQICCRRK